METQMRQEMVICPGCPTGTQPLIGGNGAVGGAVATSSDDVIYEWDYTNGGATFSAPIPGQTSPNLSAGTVNITQTTIVRRTCLCYGSWNRGSL